MTTLAVQILAVESFASLFANLEAGSSEPVWLQTFRKNGFAKTQSVGFPHNNQEDFRYSKLSGIRNTEFVAANPRADVTPADVEPFSYEGLDKHQFVFVNGEFREDLSSIDQLPKTIIATTLRRALVEHAGELQKYLGQLTTEDHTFFTGLSDALMQDGLLIFVGDGVVCDEKLHAIFLTTNEATPTMNSPRNLFVFGNGAVANLVETHASIGDGVYFKNILTEVHMGEEAQVDHYRIQRESLSSANVTTIRVYEEAKSHFRSHTLDFGGLTVRNNLYAKLDGDACDATLNALYLLRGKQHVDNFMWVEHVKEDIPSHELYKGILDEESSAVFTGRLYVHREAQRTDAKQTNQNLLLSDDARITTKPQLEIYADDVKCTHGATVGQLDPTALFYLQSRAIDKVSARNLLILAFAAEITEAIRIDSVREAVEQILHERLLKDYTKQ